ncbi:MAG: LEPR-XLL domain-containing protein, partial [bacterium]
MSSDNRNFLIEALEPRIMLSGIGIMNPTLAPPYQPLDQFSVVEECSIGEQVESLNQNNFYKPEEQISDLFDGIEQDTFGGQDNQTDASDSNPPSSSPPHNAPSLDLISQEKANVENREKVTEEKDSAQEKDTSVRKLILTRKDEPASKTTELVKTLHAANPPPLQGKALFIFNAEPGA